MNEQSEKRGEQIEKRGGRGGLLVVMVEVDPEHEEDLNRWYDEEHIPEKLATPGFRSARRFVDPAGGRYLAVYELDDPDVATSSVYMNQELSGWTKSVMATWRSWERSVWRELT
jgi:hypothetical protein